MNLPSNYRTVLVTIEKPSRTGDGSGGKAITYTTLRGSWEVRQSFYGRTSQLLRMEQAAHNAQGPGVADKTENFFVFEPPFPSDIKRDYRIVNPSGEKWKVLFVRRYAGNMQVDAELVS